MSKCWILITIGLALHLSTSQAFSTNPPQKSTVISVNNDMGEDSGGGGRSQKPGGVLASDSIDLSYFKLLLIDENESAYESGAENLCVLSKSSGDYEIHFFNALCKDSKCGFEIRKSHYRSKEKIHGCQTITQEGDKCVYYFEIQKTSSSTDEKVLFEGKDISIRLNRCKEV